MDAHRTAASDLGHLMSSSFASGRLVCLRPAYPASGTTRAPFPDPHLRIVPWVPRLPFRAMSTDAASTAPDRPVGSPSPVCALGLDVGWPWPGRPARRLLVVLDRGDRRHRGVRDARRGRGRRRWSRPGHRGARSPAAHPAGGRHGSRHVAGPGAGSRGCWASASPRRSWWAGTAPSTGPDPSRRSAAPRADRRLPEWRAGDLRQGVLLGEPVPPGVRLHGLRPCAGARGALNQRDAAPGRRAGRLGSR